MHPRRSILYNALVLTGVNLLLRGIGMLFQVWLSGLIGAAGVGLLQLVLTVGGFAMTLGLSGVRTAAMYLCAEEYGAKRAGGVRRAMELCLLYGLFFSTLTALLLYVNAPLIAARWVKDANALPALRLLAVGLPLNCAVCILSGYFTACGKLRRLVAAEVAEQIIALLLTVLLLRTRTGRGAAEACLMIVLGSMLATLCTAVWLGLALFHDLRGCGMPPRGHQLPRRLLRLCVPLALGEYLRSGLRTLEQFLIPFGLTASGHTGAQAMTAYGTICGMVFPILMFPAAVLYALSELLVPELARCRAAGSVLRVRHLCERCLRMGLLFSCCVGGMMFLCAPALGTLIYQSAEAGRYLRLFAPLIPILYTDAIVDGMCKGLGLQVACVRNNTITSVLDVALLFILLPRLGIGGYFFSFTVTHVLNFYLSVLLLLRAADCAPDARFLASLLLSTVLPAALCTLLPAPSGAWGIMLSCAVFLSLHLLLSRLLGVLTQDDRRWLRRTLRTAARASG